VEVFLGIIDLKLLKVRIAIEKLLMIRDAVILDPSGGTNKTIRKPPHVSLPVSDEKIEIVRSVMRRSGAIHLLSQATRSVAASRAEQ
jgi:hypothetical protein